MREVGALEITFRTLGSIVDTVLQIMGSQSSFGPRGGVGAFVVLIGLAAGGYYQMSKPPDPPELCRAAYAGNSEMITLCRAGKEIIRRMAQ